MLFNIAIAIPDATCARPDCTERAPIRPQILRLAPTARELEKSVGRALDDQGQEWTVVAADRPVGWIAPPDGSTDPRHGLCKLCGAAWEQARLGFASGRRREGSMALEAGKEVAQQQGGGGGTWPLEALPPIPAEPAPVAASTPRIEQRPTAVQSIPQAAAAPPIAPAVTIPSRIAGVQSNVVAAESAPMRIIEGGEVIKAEKTLAAPTLAAGDQTNREVVSKPAVMVTPPATSPIPQAQQSSTVRTKTERVIPPQPMSSQRIK